METLRLRAVDISGSHLHQELGVGGFLRVFSLARSIRYAATFFFLLAQLFFTGTASAQTELVTNGSFSSSFSGWIQQGVDSWAGTNLTNYRTAPGYAALGVDSSGWPKNDANGAFYQSISIPANATTATFSFWYNITSEEIESTAYDFLYVTIRDSVGNFLEYVDILSNLDEGTLGVYSQITYDMTSYIGQTIWVRFGAINDVGYPTIFRMDDVSVIAIIPTDTTPGPFTFTDQTGVALNTVVTSNAITVTGINAAAPISITGGTYSISGGAYTSASGTVNNGNTVAVRVISSGSYSTTQSATLTIGGVSDTFNVTTQSAPSGTTPTAITGSANSITSSSATLNGTVNPNNLSTTYYFQYSRTLPYVGTPSGTNIGSGTSTLSQSKNISSLSSNSLYYFRIVAQNSAGTSYGSDMTFTTAAAPPSAAGAFVFTVTGATLYGFFNPNGSATNAWYEWGTSTSCQNGTSCENSTTPKPIGNGTSVVQDSEQINNLKPGMTYYFRAVAQNSVGTTKGDILTFTMPSATVLPTVTTSAVTNMYSTFVGAEGIVNPNGAPLTVWFEYGTSLSYGNQTNPLSYGGTGTSDLTMNDHITGLTTGTRYYYRIVAENSAGRSEGAPQTFILGSSTVNGFETPAGYEGDPVNTSTGNYSFQRKDIKIPGKNIPFLFKRTYNSQNTQKGPLGYGWNHSYNIRLRENPINDNVTVFWGDGKSEIYTSDGAGGFSPPTGVFNTLIDNSDSTYILMKKDLTQYNFNVVDKEGTLSSVVDKNGNTVSFTYTGNNLTKITDTVGRDVNLSYDTNDRIEIITDPLGRTVQFTYDGNEDIVSSKDMNGNWTNYTYNSAHQMLTVVDPRGNTIVSNTYDNLNRVDFQFDAKNKKTGYTYDEVNKMTTITNPLFQNNYHYYDDKFRLIQEKDDLGNSADYHYDAVGNRDIVTDKNGHDKTYTYDSNSNVLTKSEDLDTSTTYTTTITYDSNNNPLTRTDALGNVTTFEYDANSNLTKTTDALGHFTTITYNANGQPLTVTDARGGVTTNTYDAEGNLIEISDALGNKTTYTYDGVGRRLTQTDALSRTITYAYDDNNNLLLVTDPSGKTIIYTYDENDNRLTLTDKNGNLTKFTYDEKDLLTTTTDALNGVVTNSYDAINRRTAVQDKNGNITQSSYDDVGNLITLIDALSNNSQFTYDANGNRLSATDPNSNNTLYTYDELNRRIRVRNVLGNATTTAYDELGRVISVTNAKAQTTSFNYDNLGRLIQVMDADGGTVQYTYDENGNRTSMTDPNGNTTTYAYDALNRLITKVEPLGNTSQYQYNAVGNLVQVTRPNGDVIQYAYDNLDRLITITYPDASAVSFSYDANGNCIQMVDSLGTHTYTYEELDRMMAHTDPFGNTVGYGYDANGNRETLIYPGNKTVTYSYDELNRMKTVSDWLGNTTTYTYDDAGLLTDISNPNGTTTAYGYDNTDRLISLINAKADSSIISSYSYTLDAIGNHEAEERDEPLMPILTPGTVNYTYDTENRLTDANGTTNNFDSNGNMIAKGTDSYDYDYENRLIQTIISGETTQYQYDGLGNRYIKTNDGTTTRYILDTNTSLTNVLVETDADDNIIAYNVYGLGLISRIQFDNTASYYHYDSRGSTVALSDVSENLTDNYAYDTFGNIVNSQGTTENPFKYVGRYGVMEEGNGLIYIRARYYAPEIGRFITKDPVTGKDGDSQSLNRYVYALDNPVIMIDPLGLFSWQTFGTGALQLTGGFGKAVGESLLAATGAAVKLVGGHHVLAIDAFIDSLNKVNEGSRNVLAGGLNIIGAFKDNAPIESYQVEGIYDPFLKKHPLINRINDDLKTVRFFTSLPDLFKGGDAIKGMNYSEITKFLAWRQYGDAITSIGNLPSDLEDMAKIIIERIGSLTGKNVPLLNETYEAQSYKYQTFKK